MTDSILQFLANQPRAFAHVQGSEKYPQVEGLVTFYDFLDGTIVMADISGLPHEEETGERGFFGFTSMKAPHAREMKRIPLPMPAPTLIPTAAPIRLMPGICRCLKKTGEDHGSHFIRNDLHPEMCWEER